LVVIAPLSRALWLFVASVRLPDSQDVIRLLRVRFRWARGLQRKVASVTSLWGRQHAKGEYCIFAAVVIEVDRGVAHPTQLFNARIGLAMLYSIVEGIVRVKVIHTLQV